MQFKKASLSLLLPLLVAACDSSQPTYSASNVSSAPPPQAQPQPQPPPPPPQPAVAPTPVAAAPAPAVAPKTPPRAPPRDPNEPSRWAAPGAPVGKMGSVAKIGVGSCDDYVERYRACFNNTATLTREQKGPLRRTLTDQLRQWKADAAAGKISQVAEACTAADQTARAEFKKVGCTTF